MQVQTMNLFFIFFHFYVLPTNYNTKKTKEKGKMRHAHAVIE